MGPTVDTGRVDEPDRRYRTWVMVGGITSLAGVAGGSGTRLRMSASCHGCSGTALLHSAIVTEKRDAFKSWTILLAILTFFAVAAGYLCRAVRAFDVGPCLRGRSRTRALHSDASGAVNRRFTGAFCVACTDDGGRWALQAGQPGSGATGKQPHSGGGHWNRAVRNALPALSWKP